MLVVGVVVLASAGLWHLGQGAADVTLTHVLGALLGEVSGRVEAVTVGSRLPRLLAGVIAGAALGLAGTLLQTVTRNPLAAPGTLGVNAGAHLAVVAAAVTGLQLGPLSQLGTAFVGAAVAAVIVVGVAAGVRLTPARLILAGVAVTLMLSALTATLMVLFEQRTAGLFFWGQGTLVQTGLDAVQRAWPQLAVAGTAALLLSRPLDLLLLGEETAAGLGVQVRTIQLATTAVAVLLAAIAVTLTGPIGFVGLVAPHAVRLSGVRRHLPLLAGAAIWGAALLVAADAAARGVRSTALSSELPAGVVTALVGAPVFVWLARRAGRGRAEVATDHGSATTSRRWPFPLVLGTAAVILLVAMMVGIVAGDLHVPLSEVWALISGGQTTGLGRRIVLDLRMPRLTVAALAGAGLAVSGALLQGVTRNPLAAPSVIGVTGGAAVGALTVLLLLPGVPAAFVPLAAFTGGILAATVVYLLAWRRGGSPTALLLVGIAVAAFTTSVVAALVVGAEIRTAQALTWLAGSTYARTWNQAATLAGWLAVLLPAAWAAGRRVDLLTLGDEVPQTLGIRLQRTRLTIVGLAVLLAASAVSVVGTLAFVGLICPHAARLLVGGRHRRLIPTTAILGATLVVLADTVGRTMIAPAQIPSGLITALLGTPYFVWLLYRTRRP